MLAAIRAACRTRRSIAVGVSLGGSALLNWLGREGSAAGAAVAAAAAVSAPLDLTAAGTAIDRGCNRVYARHFLDTLKPKGIAMAQRFPGLLDAERDPPRALDVRSSTTSSPRRCTASRTPDDYWRRASQQALARARRACPRSCSMRATILSCRLPRCRAAAR